MTRPDDGRPPMTADDHESIDDVMDRVQTVIERTRMNPNQIRMVTHQCMDMLLWVLVADGFPIGTGGQSWN